MRVVWLCTWLIVGSVAAGCASSRPAEKSVVSGQELAAPAVDPNRHMEPKGGFSWVPPTGWELITFPDSPYSLARAAEAQNFSANINISQETFPGTLEMYVTVAKDSLTQQFPEIEFLSEEKISQSFEHHRLVTKNAYEPELTLLQYFYFLPVTERQTVYIMVCTQHVNGDDLTATCDASAKSFRAETIQETARWFNVNSPAGWQSMPHADLQHEMLMAPTGTSLIFSEEPYVGELDAYIHNVLQQSGDIVVDARDEFASSAGPLTRLLTTNRTESGNIHQRHYYLTVPHRNSVFLAICTEALDASDVSECEKTVATLKVSAE